MVTRLLDGSHWQGRPSTSQLRQAKPGVVLWKCTQGTWYVDTSYATMIKRIRSVCTAGAYMFAEPGKGSAKAQVEFFLDHAKLRNGEVAMDDVEESALGQADTARFQHEVGDLLRKLHPGLAWVYLGGYASNGSGRDAADHYDRWMYPRYRSLNRITPWPSWPPYAYPAGGGTTGFKVPDVWQFSPAMRWAPGLYADASISPHTVAELAGGKRPAPTPAQGDDDVAGYVSLGLSKPIPYTAGKEFHVPWDVEYSDSAGQHAGPGGYPGILCHADTAPLWSATVSLYGLAGKATWSLTKVNMKTHAEAAYRPEADESKTINGTLGADQHLYLKIIPTADGELSGSIRVDYWKHA